jgi:putative hydrolase of the HAD superfamily
MVTEALTEAMHRPMDMSMIPLPPQNDPKSQCWIFDLDNTLYHPRHRLFDQIDAHMGRYIANLEGCDLIEARIIQKRYFHDNGTTLAGLMANHGTDPDHFLDYVHDIDLSVLPPDPALADALTQLPGRRLIFTNADAKYAARVLGQLGLDHLFEAIFDIRAANFIPKPDDTPYAQICALHAINPSQAIFFEDMARNLTPAKKIGMQTVWLDNGAESGNRDMDASMVDHITNDLTAWLHQNIKEKAPFA